ncbi:MAG TPA: hypothetical protein VK021_12265 [Flavobacteriaceae bacterium]|nr:hypothetical protein [Flavobacteriaceae bacterium]
MTAESEQFESISEEHYKVLMFGWKLAEGLRNNVETKRLKAYADWFYQQYLLPHFKLEQEHVFPIMGLKNVRVKRALANHRRLQRLFEDQENIRRSLNLIEEEIGRFIRFEERVLLKQIQEKASEKQLQEINDFHEQLAISDQDWEDEFWES